MTLNHATLKAKLSNHTGTRFLLPINSPLYLITPASPTTSIQFQRFLHPKNHNRTIRNFTKLRPIPDLFLDQRDVIKNVCYIWERERKREREITIESRRTSRRKRVWMIDRFGRGPKKSSDDVDRWLDSDRDPVSTSALDASQKDLRARGRPLPSPLFDFYHCLLVFTWE